ncbi:MULTISPECIES: prephenate dehydratase [Priestia]|uniref:prephenate dehydratase n=1 Tax=Priestia TaxID=2800373 RepID=UPI000532BF6E|nr:MULTISPECIES: prephenate dehydratase [Priestia]MED3947263.1 prephenate dehydratase [Priestia aryabhattai]
MIVGKVGYLGPKATFTHVAVQGVFKQHDHIPYKTIPACIDAVDKGEIEYGIVPLENALEGSVNLTLDYLIHERRLPIVGEIVLPIRQHLMVHPSHAEQWKNIETIYSHPHAIAQCHKFLHGECTPTAVEEMTSTAFAAKYVSEHPELNIGAIANGLAAREYGLHIACPNIHDYDHNTTRFVILHKDGGQEVPFLAGNGCKTTLMITLPSDQAGALHQVLSAFSWRKLNLSKIESRPMKTGLGNYFFIVDIEQKMDEVLIPGAMAELEALGCSVELLGSYPHTLLETEIPL